MSKFVLCQNTSILVQIRYPITTLLLLSTVARLTLLPNRNQPSATIQTSIDEVGSFPTELKRKRSLYSVDYEYSKYQRVAVSLDGLTDCAAMNPNVCVSQATSRSGMAFRTCDSPVRHRQVRYRA